MGCILMCGLKEDRLAALVILGVTPDGRKELLAMEDGYRESTESWLTVLRDLKQRGLKAPKLAIGDGGLGLLGGPETGLSRDRRTAVLGPQTGKRARQAT